MCNLFYGYSTFSANQNDFKFLNGWLSCMAYYGGVELMEYKDKEEHPDHYDH